MTSCGIGVIDKSVTILTALTAGPLALADLVTETGISRPTAHRLATGLQAHHFVSRDEAGRFCLGPAFTHFAGVAERASLTDCSAEALKSFQEHTDESAYLFQLHDDAALCVLAQLRSPTGSASYHVGSTTPLHHNAVGQVLLAHAPAPVIASVSGHEHHELAALAEVRRTGWCQSVDRKDPATACVAAAIKGHRGKLLGAVAIVGPLARMTPEPGRLHAQVACATALRISEAYLAHQGKPGRS